MAKYHINPDTGKAGVCTASVKPCKYGEDTEHYTTQAEAREAFEKSNENYQVISLSKELNIPIAALSIYLPLPEQKFKTFSDVFKMTDYNSDDDPESEDWTNYSTSETYKPNPSAAKAIRKMAGLPDTSRVAVSVSRWTFGSGDGWALDEASDTLSINVGKTNIAEIEGDDNKDKLLRRMSYADYDPKAQAEEIANLANSKEIKLRDAEIYFDDGTKAETIIDSWKGVENLSRRDQKTPIYIKRADWVLDMENNEHY